MRLWALVAANLSAVASPHAERFAFKGAGHQQAVHQIGPHGFRAIVVDSEGNRIALHAPA